MAKSGWCTAAPGARVPHEECTDPNCTCDICHERNQHDDG